MIYLSWSVVHLVVVLVLICTGTAVAYNRKVVERKKLLWLFLILISANLYIAFDVGTRQQDLQRNRFDATVPIESIKKVERNMWNREDVKQSFDATIKETK